jgi:hypothetical protein
VASYAPDWKPETLNPCECYAGRGGVQGVYDELKLERSFKNIRGDVMDRSPATGGLFAYSTLAGEAAATTADAMLCFTDYEMVPEPEILKLTAETRNTCLGACVAACPCACVLMGQCLVDSVELPPQGQFHTNSMPSEQLSLTNYASVASGITHTKRMHTCGRDVHAYRHIACA